MLTRAAVADDKLETVAEASGFQATAAYADVLRFCEALAEESPRINLESMGRTHENRDIPLLILADPPIQTAQEAAADPRPVVFAMANIHAGEVCGKEALMMLARDLDRQHSPLLQQLIIVFAPIYNADGNERFSTTHRPGQVGPARGMGQRPNAMGLDLNRDHMKLESPEARSLARFMTDWEPIVAVDLHTTDGSFHRFRLTYDSPRHPATDPQLLEYGRDVFLPRISRKLKEDSGVLTFFYGNFDRAHENWHSYPAAPRYSTHYFGLRNCLGILSEAYAYATYKQRVLISYDFVQAILSDAAANKQRLQTLVDGAKSRAETLPKVAIRFEPASLPEPVMVPGYREDEARRGRPATQDDEPVDYSVRYHGIARATLEVSRPFAYLVPATHPKVIANLKQHGIRVAELGKPVEVVASRYEIVNYKQAAREFQGHRMISDVDARSAAESVAVPAGTAVVLTAQPLARLLVNLLEPQSDDGLCTWNFFDADLKQKRFPVLRLEQPATLPLR